MLLIGFTQPSPANTLAAYLNDNNIPCRLVNDAQQFRIYLEAEADYAEAHQIAERFIRDPNLPEFQGAAWRQNSPANISFSSGVSAEKVLGFVRSAPLTSVILLVCLVMHFLLFGLGQFQLYDVFKFQPWQEVVGNSEYWRLLTPALMHASILHLAFNLGWWVFLGKDIENKLGIIFLVVLSLFAGLLSNYGQYLHTGPEFLGLSGVVYGLLGFCWWLGWLKPALGISVAKPVVGFMLLWLVIGFADVLWIKMGNMAHLVGLCSGCVMALIISKTTKTL